MIRSLATVETQAQYLAEVRDVIPQLGALPWNEGRLLFILPPDDDARWVHEEIDAQAFFLDAAKVPRAIVEHVLLDNAAGARLRRQFPDGELVIDYAAANKGGGTLYVVAFNGRHVYDLHITM